MTLTTTDVVIELRDILEDAITQAPRSLQATLGPSEIGTACDRCLVHLLAGHKTIEHVVPWLPTIGTAVHAWIEKVIHARRFYDGDLRWHPEERLLVGHLAGQPIHGTCDLFDEQTGTVIDYKIVGKTTLDKVRRSGASLTYQRQAHLYGKGWEDAGRDVREVVIYFLPRNAVSLQHAQPWRAPYDRSHAQAALDRANALAAGIASLGVDAVLDMTPAHTGEEFACGRFPQDSPPPGGAGDRSGHHTTTTTLLNL